MNVTGRVSLARGRRRAAQQKKVLLDILGRAP